MLTGAGALLREDSRPSTLVGKKSPAERPGLAEFLEPTAWGCLPGTWFRRPGTKIALFKYFSLGRAEFSIGGKV
jgi:hypothetical protein